MDQSSSQGSVFGRAFAWQRSTRSIGPSVLRRRKGQFGNGKVPFESRIGAKFRDKWNETALFYAIRNGHTEIVKLLRELGASLDVKSTNRITPCTLLEESQPEVLRTARKRKATAYRDSAVPGAPARALLTEWEYGEDEKEPVLPVESIKALVENEDFVVCEAVQNCAKRLRRSEREFAAEHAHLHAALPWYEVLTPQDAADLVGIPVLNPGSRLPGIENLASGKCSSAFTLAAVSRKQDTSRGTCTQTFPSRLCRLHAAKLTNLIKAQASEDC